MLYISCQILTNERTKIKNKPTHIYALQPFYLYHEQKSFRSKPKKREAFEWSPCVTTQLPKLQLHKESFYLVSATLAFPQDAAFSVSVQHLSTVNKIIHNRCHCCPLDIFTCSTLLRQFMLKVKYLKSEYSSQKPRLDHICVCNLPTEWKKESISPLKDYYIPAQWWKCCMVKYRAKQNSIGQKTYFLMRTGGGTQQHTPKLPKRAMHQSTQHI